MDLNLLVISKLTFQQPQDGAETVMCHSSQSISLKQIVLVRSACYMSPAVVLLSTMLHVRRHTCKGQTDLTLAVRWDTCGGLAIDLQHLT